MRKELSIIVTSYKNSSVLRLCLESLRKNIFLENYEILVLDSSTEEDTETMMREDFPNIRFFPHTENTGFSKLVNEGLEKARGEYVLILNADIIVKRRSVEIMLEYLRNNSDVGIVGPKLLNFDGNLQYSCFRFYTLKIILYRRTFLGKFKFAKKTIRNFLLKDKDHKKIIEADWIMGSALMTSRKAIAEVGIMDENFFMYFEDVDWCRRFWEKGYKVVYYPKAEMFHYHGKGSANISALKAILFNRLTRIHLGSAMRYFWKYFGKPNPHQEKS